MLLRDRPHPAVDFEATIHSEIYYITLLGLPYLEQQIKGTEIPKNKVVPLIQTRQCLKFQAFYLEC